MTKRNSPFSSPFRHSIPARRNLEKGRPFSRGCAYRQGEGRAAPWARWIRLPPRMWRKRGDARPPLREGREVRILIPRAATPRTAKEQLRAAARGTLRTGYCDREIGGRRQTSEVESSTRMHIRGTHRFLLSESEDERHRPGTDHPLDENGPLTEGALRTESSILAQDERWRRA